MTDKVPATGKGFTLWLTGLPRSGKSTVAGLVAGRLRALGIGNVELLDGDIVREGLCRDLGFSREDRTENIRRISFVSQAPDQQRGGRDRRGHLALPRGPRARP